MIAIDLDGPIAQHDDSGVVSQADWASGNIFPWWRPEGWADLQVVPGARAGIEQLLGEGHRLSIVTARAENPITFQWLGAHDIHLPVNHVRNKWQVPANCYLDDSVMQLEALRARRLMCVKWVTKNNVGAAANFSVSTWPEFVELVRSGRCHGKLRRRPRVLR